MSNTINFTIRDREKPVRGSPAMIIWGIVLIVLIMIVSTMFYTVQAEYQGIVLRFGKYIKTVEPGLHFKLPMGIDEVHLVPVRRQLKQEFGFGSPGATSRTQYASSRAEQEGERNMVSGDLNAATVEWIIQFRVMDPQQFLFRVRNPETTLRNISESVMRAVVGDRTVDEVITVGRQEIESVALTQMQEVVNLYQLGLIIDQVQLKDVNPPRKVQPSFNEVNQAQQEREQMINIANGEYNRVIPRARGEAEQRIQSAEGYALRRINEAQGEVSRFNAVLAEYIKAPDVTRQRLYLETLATVIPNMGGKYVIDHEATQILPLLQLHERGQQ